MPKSNLLVKQKFYKKGLFDLHQQVYELIAEISHEYCMGRLANIDWIVLELGDIEGKISDLERL